MNSEGLRALFRALGYPTVSKAKAFLLRLGQHWTSEDLAAVLKGEAPIPDRLRRIATVYRMRAQAQWREKGAIADADKLRAENIALRADVDRLQRLLIERFSEATAER